MTDAAARSLTDSVSTIAGSVSKVATRPLNAMLSKMNMVVDVNIKIGSFIHIKSKLGEK